MFRIDFKSKKGFSIIEILAVIAIITIGLSSLLGLAVSSLKASAVLEETNQANDLAQEDMEAIRNFRDGTSWDSNGLGTLTSGIDYYCKAEGSPEKWQFVQGTETIGIFTRRIVFRNVSRDANGNIVSSGGVVDPDTKEASVFVDWQGKEIELDAYFTNWR